MSDALPRHPGAGTMAAFVEGTLPREEMTAVAAHLEGCRECRTVVAETAQFEEEERQLARRQPRYRWLAAAAAIGVAALTIPLLRDDRASSSPVASLIEAAPRAHRNVEARCSGFPWARLQAPVRGEAAPDPEDLKLAGAAGSVLQETTGDATPRSQHAAGVAYLMIGRATEAVAALERAAKTANEPRMWNDVAAAHHHLATTSNRASHLPLALAAVRRALELDPRSAEALFNRALILEAMGLRDQARAAWQAYLALDPSSGWSNEAREHLRRLGNDTAFDFRGALERASRDPHALAQLARAHPEDARRWGEGPLLRQWADAELAHDADRAATHLAIVRVLGHALADSLLRDSVAAIETAASRAVLARAHLLYDEGRIAQRNRDGRTAEPKLREAETLFRRGGSPMAHVAAFHAENAAFEVKGADTAELDALYARVDRRRHRALAAQIHGQLALIANMRSDWVRAAREAGAGASTFRALGEQANAGNLDGIAACALELLGDRDAAWKQRVAAWSTLPAAQRGRRDAMLHSAALTLAATGNAPAAHAMLDLVDDRAANPVVAAESLAQRAELAARSGDAKEAQRRLAEARAAAATLTDASVREATGARIDVAEAALYTRSAPGQAITLATRALTTSRARGITSLAPDALLQRARAHAAAGDDDAASADYALALETIEQTRGTIEDADLRLASFDTATQLMEDAIDHHLGRGRVAEGLRVTDRARVVRQQRPIAAPPRGSVVVEYVVRPQSVVIFELTVEGLRAERVTVDRAVLGARVTTLADAIRRRASIDVVKAEASELYRLLIAPLRLDGVEELVLIPDRELFALPFAALYDASRQQYLVERLALRFAPSAAEAGDGGGGSLAPATVVADPPSAQWRPLARAREEAQAIAAMHGAEILAGSAATRAAFVEAAQRSALIHYAGHADSDAGASYGALVLAAEANDGGMLASGDIARLRLPLHPLVVLAACGTFRGDPMHAGGMASLARSFLSAGARAVVGTLWEIDDADAAPLFRQFHAHLRAGALPARALRSAQLAMLRSSDPRLRHPATWSVVSCLAIHEERRTS